MSMFNIEMFIVKVMLTAKRNGIELSVLEERCGFKKGFIESLIDNPDALKVSDVYTIAECFKVSANYLLSLGKEHSLFIGDNSVQVDNTTETLNNYSCFNAGNNSVQIIGEGNVISSTISSSSSIINNNYSIDIQTLTRDFIRVLEPLSKCDRRKLMLDVYDASEKYKRNEE